MSKHENNDSHVYPEHPIPEPSSVAALYEVHLPEPVARRHLHNRQINYRGYLRDDGLWDIEGELKDSKNYGIRLGFKGHLAAGEAVHGMTLRLTIDEQMVIKEAYAAMPVTPYQECLPAHQAIQLLVGQQMGAGWRKLIGEKMGRLKSCTHLRELLQGAATAAYQTIFPYRNRISSNPVTSKITEVPKHLDTCIAWDKSGAVTKQYYPMFFVEKTPR